MIEIERNQISVINRYIATACSALIAVAFLEIPKNVEISPLEWKTDLVCNLL